MITFLKTSRIILAVVLLANSVYAGGKTQINVTREELKESQSLRTDVGRYYWALRDLSAARFNEVQFNSLQSEVEKFEELHRQKQEELRKMDLLIAQADNGDVKSLQEKRNLISAHTIEVGNALIVAIDKRNNFQYSVYSNSSEDASFNTPEAIRVKKQKNFEVAKIQVIRRVTVNNQEMFLKQLTEYEKSKGAWVQSQILMKQIDDLYQELDLLQKEDFTNPIFVKKYGKISAEPSGSLLATTSIGTFVMLIPLSMFADIGSRTGLQATIAAMAVLAGASAYMYYKRSTSGSETKKANALILGRLRSLHAELEQLNVELKASTADMELIIESFQ